MANNPKKWRWYWRFGATVILTFVITLWWVQQNTNSHKTTNEPSYQGKSLSAWVVEASSVPDDNDPGLNAIRTMGSAVIPHLLKAFREGKLPTSVLRNGRDVQTWEVQKHAAEALKFLGPMAAEVAPELVKCLKVGDKEMRSQSAEILATTGVTTKPVRDALMSALNDPDVAYEASRALATLGRKETNIIQDLMVVAKDRKNPAAYWAVVSFAQLGARSKPALPILIELADNPTPDSDWEAIKAIGMIGPEAANAVPVLIKVLKMGGPWARKCAVISLGRIGPAAKAAIPALQDFQRLETSSYTKADIARALRRIDRDQLGAALTMAQSIVEDELRAARTEGRISYGLLSALDLLGELGTNGIPAMPIVMKALQFNDSDVQLCAYWAARQIDPSQQSLTTNVLWRLAEVENYPLEDFKSFNFLAEPKRNRESFHIRIAAVAMLWQIEPETKVRLKPILKQLLKEWTLWTSMKQMIPEDVVLAPVLREFLNDETCRDIYPQIESVLEQVTGADAERW